MFAKVLKNTITKRTFSTSTQNHRLLVTGSKGQVGPMFVRAIAAEFGSENVIASDVDPRPVDFGGAKSVVLDVVDSDAVDRIVQEEGITYIVHLAAILSALGENNVDLAYKVNVDGTTGIFNAAKNHGCKVYMPSSIAVFGGDAFDRDDTKVDSVLQPTTIYGVSKVFNELLGTYYHEKFGVDFRSLRYPGVISSQLYAFNGTTDYATEMFFEVLKTGKYECWLKEDTYLPMIYIDDCIDATVRFLKADSDDLSRRVYNLGGKSFCPGELAKSVKKLIPHAEITYKPNQKQAIADSWCKKLDDVDSTTDWGWTYDCDMDQLAKKILDNIDD